MKHYMRLNKKTQNNQRNDPKNTTKIGSSVFFRDHLPCALPSQHYNPFEVSLNNALSTLVALEGMILRTYELACVLSALNSFLMLGC